MDAAALYDFLVALQEDLAAGTLAPVETYLRRFPRLEAEVRLEYRRALEPAAGAGTAATDTDVAPRRVGPYRLLRQLGRGGQGEVHLAHDESLDRRVALKVLTSFLGRVPPEKRARFRREAKIIAQLAHPGLCSILEADLEAELPYIAMPLIEGQSLAELIVAAREGEPRAELLPCRPTTAAELERLLLFFEQAAEALHAAHEAGVLHRDVKPGNLMVTGDGHPVVVDFGLAHADDPAQETLTRTDEVFGTLTYMAPEQLDLGRAPVDARADVYSLGASLYEALTLQPPFEGSGWPALCRAIQHDPVPDARVANPIVPQAIHAVLTTAMDKDPRRRYASAAELGADLARARRRTSVLGKTPGRALRVTRWARRSPRAAGALAVLVVAVFLGLGWFSQYRRVAEAGEERGSEQLAVKYQKLAREVLGQSTAIALRQAYRAWTEDPNGADELLVTTLDQLWEERRVWAHRAVIRVVDVHPGRGLALSGDLSGELKFWRVADGAQVGTTCVAPGAGLSWAAFSPQGDAAATTALDGAVRLWSVTDPDASSQLGRHDGAALLGAFHPDGLRLASAGDDGQVRLWDIDRRQALGALEHERGQIRALAWSPTGESLVSVTVNEAGEARLHLWDAARRELRGSWLGHSQPVLHLGFRTDGQAFLTASEDGSVRTWDAHDPGRQLARFEHGAPVRHFDLDRSGGRLVTAHERDRGGTSVTVWDTGTGAALNRLPASSGTGAREVRLDPAGERLCVLSADLSLQLHSLETGALERRMTGHQLGAVSFRWAEEGARIVSASEIRYLHTWYARERPFLRTLELGGAPIEDFAFVEAGRVLRVRDRQGRTTDLSWPQLLVVDSATGSVPPTAQRGALDGEVTGLLASRVTSDGTRVRVLTQEGGRIEREELATGEVTARELGFAPLRAHVGPAGEVAVVAPNGWTVQLFDAQLKGPRVPWDGNAASFRLACFAPDGATVLSASVGGTVKRWDTRTGALLLEYPHDANVTALAFSPDGRSVLVGLERGAFKIWPVDLAAAARAASPWYDSLLGPWDRERELAALGLDD